MIRIGSCHLVRDGSIGVRLFSGSRQCFEFSPRFGLSLEIEFPSDWHEDQSIIVSWCLVWGCFYVMLPCWRRWPDHGQCSGPRFGFRFFEDVLMLHYGNDDGTPKGYRTAMVKMPWGWRFRRRDTLSGPEHHSYQYTLNSGEVQYRRATIHVEEAEWWRPWLPWRKVVRSIDVSFDDEVGERTGSWKGGVLGCGYSMRPGERPVDTLRRMERQRRFH